MNKEKFDDFEGPGPGSDKNVSHPFPMVRVLQSGDAARLRSLRLKAIRECPWNFGTALQVEQARSTAYYRRQLSKAFQARHSRLLGLWTSDELAGIAGIRRTTGSGSVYGLIYSMYIEPGLRGNGFGRAMLRSAQQELLRRWPVTRLRMQVEVHNQRALRLYQQEGFRVVETEKAAFRLGETPYDIHVVEKAVT